MNRNISQHRPNSAVALAIVLSMGLGGCSFFRPHVDYGKAAESRPLEIPPDLDSPSTGSELVVPPVGTAATAAAPAPVSAGATASPPASASALPPSAPTTLIGKELHVADTVANTWQRVGLALERSKIANVTARDESAHTYALEFSGETRAPASGRWYSRILHPFGGDKQTVTSQLTVRISDDSGGARVGVEGDGSEAAAAAAQRVLDVLRERLS